MRISIVYNLRTDDTEATAELLSTEDIDRIYRAVTSLRHSATLVEASGPPNRVVERILEGQPWGSSLATPLFRCGPFDHFVYR